MKKIIAIVTFTLAATFGAHAQHEHHNMPDTSKPKMQMSDTMHLF